MERISAYAVSVQPPAKGWRMGPRRPGGREQDASLWGTLRALKTILALPAVLLLVGCSAMVADPTETAKRQILANQATAHFRVAPVAVQPVAGHDSAYLCREAQIRLAVRAGYVRFRLAHELGHHMLNHCGTSYAQELAANAVAIQVLQLWGLSEADAVRETVVFLLEVKKFQGNAQRPGHNVCGEAAAP